jgi:hypothetical protein
MIIIFSNIANKYYFESQNNIFGVIVCEMKNEISLIWNFEDYIQLFLVYLEYSKFFLREKKLYKFIYVYVSLL